jgi:hypothetical protein
MSRGRAATRLAAAFLALLLPGAAMAVPPGGPVERPLGATVTLASATVAPAGTVTVRGAGYDPGEHVSIKVDDGRVRTAVDADVFATADAGADGTFSAAVDLGRAASAHADALRTGTHNLRLLSAAGAGARSIHVDFTVEAPPAGGGAGPGADPGADGGAGDGGAGSGAGTGDAGPGGPGGSGGGGTTPAKAAAIASTTLRATGAAVAVRLRGGTAAATGVLTLRTTSGVTLGRTVRCALPAGAARTVRVTLTRPGRALLQRKRRVAARVRFAPSGGAAVVKTLTLKAA